MSCSLLDRSLLHAAASGDLASVERLLDQGADIDARDEENRTAAMRAAEGGHAAVVRRLIAHAGGTGSERRQGDAALVDQRGGITRQALSRSPGGVGGSVMNGMLLSEFLRLGQQALAQYGDRELWLPGDEDEDEDEESEEEVSLSITPLQEITLAPVKLDEEHAVYLLIVNGELVGEDVEEPAEGG